ncbi:MAG: sulfotransferase, partial [Gammaproteobacteria bacterium]|nr:sulfotransferase [Gammaproteobacteria bacterium]
LQCLNQFDEAIEEYKLAITLDKTLIEAHYYLGNIYQLIGSPESAAESFYKAIELNPDFYEALNNLGATLIELNRPIDAKKVIDRALIIDPNSIQLLCNVAGFYFLDNNLEKALGFAERAYKADPTFVDALKILGKIHYQKSDYSQALDFYKKAYSFSNDIKLTAYIAQILERRSEFSEANKLITPLIEAGQTDIVTLLTYSALSRKFNNQREAVEHIEASIIKDDITDASLISLHSDLGKHYDSFKEFNKAFDNYEKANLLERKLNKQFEHLNEIKQLDNTNAEDIERWFEDYPKAFWQSLPSSGNESARPIFIIGMFRSGTTLCEQILSSHPDVHGAGELPDINNLSYSIKPLKLHDKSPASLVDVTQAQLQNAAESYLNTLKTYSATTRRVVDKMPTNFTHVGLITKLFPKAHIVHMIRDPRDSCLSMYFQRFGPKMTFSTDLVELADYHLAYQQAMEYWNEVLDIKIHNVVYEDLMEDQESMTRKMLEFCGLEWSDKCMNFHQSKRDINTPSYDQVRKPLYKKSVARWKNYEKYIHPLTERLGLNEKT